MHAYSEPSDRPGDQTPPGLRVGDIARSTVCLAADRVTVAAMDAPIAAAQSTGPKPHVLRVQPGDGRVLSEKLCGFWPVIEPVCPYLQSIMLAADVLM